MHRPPPANRLPFPPTAHPSHGHVMRERRAPAMALIGRRRERGVWWEGVGRAHIPVTGWCCPLWRRTARWWPKLAEVDASAGLCPFLPEGRGFKMRVIGKVRQKGGALSFSLGNTLPIISLASPRRLRLMPSGLPVRRRRLVELLPGCALTPSYRLIPLVSQCNGWDGSGVLETSFCLRRGVGSPAFFQRFEAGVVARWLGWAEHHPFGPPPCPSEGSDGPTVSHRFAWVLPLSSFAELCRGAASGRDREGPKTVSVILLGPGLWAWIMCCLEKPLFCRCTYLRDGGVKGRARLRGCHRPGRRRANLNRINSFNSWILCMGIKRKLGLVLSVLLMVPSLY